MSAQDESAERPATTRGRLTDSPWFWLLLFANAGLIGLATIGPKYNLRQGAVERRYETRREVARRAAQAEADRSSAANPDESEPRSPVVLEETEGSREASAHLVPLLPLAVVMIVVNLVAIVLFTVSRVRLLKAEAENRRAPSP